MLNLNTLFLFVFVFSILTNIRLVIRFIGALLHNPPERLELSSGGLIFHGIMMAYLITYIITTI